MSDVQMISDQLAEISVVKSVDLVDNMDNQNGLITAFNQIESASNRALAVKSVLERTPVLGVTQTFGTIMDKQLERIGVMDDLADDVEGVEALGRTMHPSVYLQTRIAGCESFLNKAAQQTAKLLTLIGESVRNRYVLLVESNTSLQKRLSLLESELALKPPMKRGAKRLKITSNASLFVVNGTIRDDFAAQLEKVDKTIHSLVENYYKSNQWAVNDLLGVFGGFNGLSQPEAEDLFKSLPTKLNGLIFDQCVYPNRALSNSEVKVRNSVELMGGRVFVNALVTARPARVKTPGEVIRWLDYYVANEYVKLEKLPKPDFDTPPEIDSFSTVDIKAAIKLSRRILNDTATTFSDGDKYSIVGTDYTDITSMLSEADWDGDFKSSVLEAFNLLASKYNRELLTVRSQVVEYITLLINGYIGLALTSMDA